MKNYILGLAGHVDHGKTSLIKALTGIDPTRHQEAKQKGMTYDLGFTFFNSKHEYSVGIIDVPGHEKFLHNMVSGIWSVDCILFVVALDDGLMPMSFEHGHLIRAFKITSLIFVLSKKDKVNSQRIAEVREDIKKFVHKVFGDHQSFTMIEISTYTMEGIDLLKDQIYQNLITSQTPTYLKTGGIFYVDRLFDKKGVGDIITGSLKGNQPIQVGDVLTNPQHSQLFKIKSIQAHQQSLTKVYPSHRIAITFATKHLDVRRGDLFLQNSTTSLWEQSFFIEVNHLYFENEFPKLHRKRFGICFGSVKVEAKLFLYDEQKKIDRTGRKMGLLVFDEKIGILKNSPLIGMSLGTGRLQWSGKVLFEKKDSLLTLKEIKQLYHQFVIHQEPLTSNDQDLWTFGLFNPRNFQLPSFLNSLAKIRAGVGVLNSVLNQKLNDLTSLLQKNASGIPIDYLKQQWKLPATLIEACLEEGVFSNRIRIQSSIIYPIDEGLTPTMNNILKQLERYLETIDHPVGDFKIAFKDQPSPPLKMIRALHQKKYLCILEEPLFMKQSTYEKYKEKLLQMVQIGHTCSILDVKNQFQWSRKYILPFLNRLDTEGFFKRVGNLRQRIK